MRLAPPPTHTQQQQQQNMAFAWCVRAIWFCYAYCDLCDFVGYTDADAAELRVQPDPVCADVFSGAFWSCGTCSGHLLGPTLPVA